MPLWPIQRLRRRPGFASPDRKLATVETQQGQRRLAAVCPGAAAHGLAPDQPLAMARAICPDLALAEADPAADAAGLAALARWCTRHFTPLAAPDPPEGLWLDVTGCAGLFGGEAGLAETLARRLAGFGLQARLAMAGASGAAWALARAGQRGDPVFLPPGGERAALSALPVGLLRLEARSASLLRRLGVKTIGDLAALPRADLAARFGSDRFGSDRGCGVLARLDQALGRIEEPIAWPMPAMPWEERLAFAEPLLTADSLAAALDRLAARLCARLERAGRGGGAFIATFTRVDGAEEEITVTTARPVREAAWLLRLLAEKLGRVDPGFGIEAIRLATARLAPLGAAQAALLGGAGMDEAPGGKLAATVDLLANRLGPASLWRAQPWPSHVPERALRPAPPLSPSAPWPRLPPRPLRLLARPEPIEATAPVPDAAPLQFRWRGALHRVRAASGPERIGAEWWHHAPPGPAERSVRDRLRDYYRVEDTEGARFWVFRAGLEERRRWFLHGIFP